MADRTDQDRNTGPFRALARMAWPFVLVNLFALAVYRWLFVLAYVGAEGRGDLGAILGYGLRLDLALLSAVLAVVVIVSILRGRIALRWVSLTLITVTGLNLALSTMNFVFYGVRGEPMGRLLVANVTSPGQMFGELWAYTRAHGALMGLGALLLSAFVVLAVRLQRRVPRWSWRHLSPPRGLGLAAALVLLLLVPVFQPIEICEGDVEVGGWTVDLASARHYQRLDDHASHQAIPNPLHELVFTRLPQVLAPSPRSRLDPREAIGVLRGRLRGMHLDADYPLLRRVEHEPGLDAAHVLILQVEGLSGGIVERVEEGRAVMPFLRSLVGRSLYFPNTLQTYPTTYGGVHGLTASLPRTTACVTSGRFTIEELEGYFGSLPRVLGREGHFLHGARTCAEDMRAYMGSQGYRTSDYRALRAELLATGMAEDAVEGEIGIWDRPCLRAAADRLIRAGAPRVVHVMTATSHSPWTLPDGVEAAFEDPVLACQRYVDDALRACYERLAAHPAVLARTLLVVTADHASLPYGPNELDCMRIPLLFHHPSLEPRRDERWATLPDVVPTILHLLGGTWRYAGLGRDLLGGETAFGALFGNEQAAFYLEGDRLLRFDFAADRVTFHHADPAGWSSASIGVDEKMKGLFFGLLEGTRRVVESGRVYPR